MYSFLQQFPEKWPFSTAELQVIDFHQLRVPLFVIQVYLAPEQWDSGTVSNTTN